MVNKYSRISNFVVFCVLQEISKRDDHIRQKERNLKEWLQDREAALGADQAALTFAAMYIDDLSAITVGKDESRAKHDYEDAVRVIEKGIGLQAQLEHGTESPPTEHRIDLLGATFDITASDLDASDRFKTKAT